MVFRGVLVVGNPNPNLETSKESKANILGGTGGGLGFAVVVALQFELRA